MSGGNREIDDATLRSLGTRRYDPREVSPDCNAFVSKVGTLTKGDLLGDASKGEMTFLRTSATNKWPSAFDKGSCHYRLVQGTTTVGYLRRRTDGIDWYGLPGQIEGGYFPAVSMSFVANTDSGTGTAFERKDDLL